MLSGFVLSESSAYRRIFKSNHNLGSITDATRELAYVELKKDEGKKTKKQQLQHKIITILSIADAVIKVHKAPARRNMQSNVNVSYL